MSKSSIEHSKMMNGVWEALLLAPGRKTAPPLVAKHRQKELEGLEVKRSANNTHWLLRLPIPVEILSDGVQTVMIERTDTGEIVGSFALISGESDSFDIRAELDLLRAELDLLKTTVRRALRN